MKETPVAGAGSAGHSAQREVSRVEAPAVGIVGGGLAGVTLARALLSLRHPPGEGAPGRASDPSPLAPAGPKVYVFEAQDGLRGDAVLRRLVVEPDTLERVVARLGLWEAWCNVRQELGVVPNAGGCGGSPVLHAVYLVWGLWLGALALCAQLARLCLPLGAAPENPYCGVLYSRTASPPITPRVESGEELGCADGVVPSDSGLLEEQRQSWWASRDDILQMMAGSLPPDSLRFGKKLRALVHEVTPIGGTSDGLWCEFEDGTTVGPFQWVVGADGYYSTVHRLCCGARASRYSSAAPDEGVCPRSSGSGVSEASTPAGGPTREGGCARFMRPPDLGSSRVLLLGDAFTAYWHDSLFRNIRRVSSGGNRALRDAADLAWRLHGWYAAVYAAEAVPANSKPDGVEGIRRRGGRVDSVPTRHAGLGTSSHNRWEGCRETALLRGYSAPVAVSWRAYLIHVCTDMLLGAPFTRQFCRR